MTRKITDTVAKIHLGKADVLELGNLDAKRDWGFARDYTEGMYRILHHDTPETFVLATNRTETVREFVTLAFLRVGIAIEWSGSAEREVGVDPASGRTLVRVNPKYYRPAEVDMLIGDSSKAREKLGWEATTSLEQLCNLMVDADLRRNEFGVSL